MTKKDLKTGMRVTTRNGNKYLIFLNTNDGDYMANYNRETYVALHNVDDNLSSSCSSDFDIIEVYAFTNGGGLLDPDNYWEKIWNRETEIEEISADEAMRRLEQSSGKKIKITR